MSMAIGPYKLSEHVSKTEILVINERVLKTKFGMLRIQYSVLCVSENKLSSVGV